jgi:predicted amidohydrolase YtcJ
MVKINPSLPDIYVLTTLSTFRRYPNEKLSRTAALKGMTLNAAYASFQESLLGSLETGKKSDIVILDKDIMRVEEKVILEARVRGVIIDGRIAWGTV